VIGLTVTEEIDRKHQEDLQRLRGFRLLDVDWSKYVSALTDIGYDGCTCIEVEDRAFEGSKEKVEDSLILSRRYLKQFVI